MTTTLFLSDKIRPDFDAMDKMIIQSFLDINIRNKVDYDNKLIEVINKTFNSISLSDVKYVEKIPYKEQSVINKSLGIIVDDITSQVLAYVILIPPISAASRTGLVAQQLFPTLTDLMHERNFSTGNLVTDKTILVINTNKETYTASNALAIIGVEKITEIYYTDIFERNPYDVLSDNKNINFSLSNINNFSNAINLISSRSSEKFIYDSNNKKLELLQGNLVDSGSSMTNQPYYYLIQVMPAIFLAEKDKIEVDDTKLRDWWREYKIKYNNKNMEYFLEWLDKLKDKGNKTMQKIYFGSPGTGKSHKIEEFLTKNVNNVDKQVYRTTFHPEYSYSDFVGQIIPNRVYDSITETYSITYEFSEGIFTQALKKAYEDFNLDIYLIIEEMSRGNVSAIFGDLFQLLDRNTSGTEKGWSKYGIRNVKISEQIVTLTSDVIKLPPNFHILGTVNMSDQNVFSMDTAFKRRFQWEYIMTNPIVNPKYSKSTNLELRYLNNPIVSLELGKGIEEVFWTDLYGTLNTYICNKNYLDLGEDKQIGPFFIDFTALNEEEIKAEIKNKLLNYLWTDISNSRNSRKMPLFNDSVVSSFSSLYKGFESNKQIFSNEFIAAYRQWKINKL